MQLKDISAKMTKLDFETKYQSQGKNEIDLLGEHINQLSEALEKTISELKTANNELQQDIRKKEQIDEMRKEFCSLWRERNYEEGISRFLGILNARKADLARFI